MTPASPLAKLTRPQLEAVAARPRLFRRIDDVARRGVVWIEGPPGSGKTTLVASYLERSRSRTLWYRLDEADDDPATFFHYFGVAARRLAPSRRPWPRFRPGAGVDVPTFARHFFRAVHAALGGSFVLVFDDYHELPPGSPLHAVIRAALSERPPGARVFLLSRAGPPPALARLRVAGELDRIAPEELLLSSEESKAVVRVRRRRADATMCDALHARAGGWAAGLTLLLASGDAGQDPIAGLGGSREIFDYLAGEVLERSDPQTRRVLLETALLPQVSAAAARDVTGIGSADAILADLAHRGYFTYRHGERGAYTFHPLFRDFLTERARHELPPARLAEVQRAAAAQAVRSGAMVEAFSLYRNAGDDTGAARLLCDRAPALIEEGRSQTLRRLVAELPPSLQEDPWVSYWFGASFHGDDLEGARVALERAHAAFLARGDAMGAYRACAAILDSYALEWVDFRPLERWIAEFEALRRRWPAFPDADVETRCACGIFTALSAVRPADPELPRWQHAVEVVAASATDGTSRERARFALAQFALWRGDQRASRAVLASTTRSARARGRDPAFDIGWMVQGARAAATSGDGTASLALVEEALAAGDATGNHWWDVGARLVGVWAATLLPDLPRAQEYLARLERDFDVSMQTYIAQVRALVRLRSGDVPAARNELLQALELDRGRGAVYAESWDHAALASIAAMDGDGEALRRHLGEAERLAATTCSHIVRYWSLLLRAGPAAGSDDDAVRCAAEALRLSRDHGPFDEMWVEAATLARACARALDHGIEEEEARAIIERRRLTLPPGVACDGWPHPVTVRTLGDFSVQRAAAKPAATSGTRPEQLLKALVALGGRDIEEWRLSEGLWPDAEPDQAQHALEMNLSRLRKLLGMHDAITQSARKLSLDPGACWVDADALEALLARTGPTAPATEVEDVSRRVLSLYRGAFLPSDEGAWARTRRDRIRRRLLAFRSALDAASRTAGRADEAGAFWRTLAERDPALAGTPVTSHAV